MLDAKTISATLLLGLMGCSSGTTEPQTSDGDAPTTTATTTTDTTAATTETAPATTGSTSSAPAASSVSSAEVTPKGLPMGRAEPLPPADKTKKPSSPDKSVRTGADSCCGQGSCGPCKPLPKGRAQPAPPKDGKAMPASQSKRTGKETCCGEGSCGPC